jgi:DNA-directed RNA polymerase subunit RPC12/RpoP
MTSTFLHEDKNVPPDEAEERDAPKCAVCGHQMWMTRVDTQLSDCGTQSRREYECSHCGAKRSVETSSDRITPLASVAVDTET